MKKPYLLIMTGPPGSGKTHFAVEFCRAYDMVHINSGQTRMRFFVNHTFTEEERSKVYDKMYELVARNLEKGNSVVFDGNIMTNNARREVFRKYSSFAKVLFLKLTTPKGLAVGRAMARPTTEDTLYKPMSASRTKEMHDQFEDLGTELPFIAVDGTSDVELEIKRIGSLLI